MSQYPVPGSSPDDSSTQYPAVQVQVLDISKLQPPDGAQLHELHELQPMYGGVTGHAAQQVTFLQDMDVLVGAEGHESNYTLLPKDATESMYVLSSDEHYAATLPGSSCELVEMKHVTQQPAVQAGMASSCGSTVTELQAVPSTSTFAEMNNDGSWQSATEVDIGGIKYIVPDNSNPKLSQSSVTRLSPGTVQWLLENYETAEGQSLPRYALYTHYLYHCQENGFEPVNAASFGKLIRAVFLGLRTRRLGTRGNSKYHYYGIRVKPGSKLNNIPLTSPINGKQRSAPRRPPTSPGQFYLGGNSYTPCRPMPNTIPLTKPFGDASRAIPDFPPIEIPPGSNLPKDDVEIFHYIYKEHLEAFVDALMNLELGTVESLLHEFWRSNGIGGEETEEEKYFPKSKLYLLCECPYVQQFVENVDYHFYQNMLWVLVPDVLKPLPGNIMKSLQDLGNSFKDWLVGSMKNCPQDMVRVKVSAATALVHTLRRYLSLNYIAQAASSLLCDQARITEMLVDMHRVDLAHIYQQASWVTRCDENTVICFMEELKLLLQEASPLENWAAWLKGLAQKVLQPYEGKPLFPKMACKFLLKWSYYSSAVMREITLLNASSFGSLFLLRLLFDEYVYYMVEHRLAQETNQIPLLVFGQILPGSMASAASGQEPNTESDVQTFAA